MTVIVAVVLGLITAVAFASIAAYLDGQGPGQPGRPPAAALVLYRQATDLLSSGILPAARALTDQNTAALDHAYQAKRSTAQYGALWVTLAGRSQQLVRLPGAGIFQYDAALARVLSAYRADHADVRFGGYFGVEFRNITFAGERAAAEKALAAYQVYERDDRHIRALNRGGNLRGAIAFDTSYAPGNSNWAFTEYDNALVALIAINQRAFTGAISAGQQDMTGWTWLIPGAVVVLTSVLVLAGVRPRLAEYRYG